jgi:hypothetical protein
LFPGFGFCVHNAWEFYNFGRDLHNFLCNFWTSWWMIHVPSYIFTIMFWAKKPLLPTKKIHLQHDQFGWTILLNVLTSHHWLQSPLKVKMINIHCPQGLTLTFPVHFKGNASNDPNHSQAYYNRQDLTWPNGELNQQGGPQNVRGTDLLMLLGLMIWVQILPCWFC